MELFDFARFAALLVGGVLAGGIFGFSADELAGGGERLLCPTFPRRQTGGRS